MRHALWTLLFSLVALTRAENLNLSTAPETTTVGISPYSLGVGVGALMPANEELANRDPAFLKLSIVQTLRFQDHLDLGMDLDWWLPGINPGGTLNLDFLFGRGAFRPFLGAGVGFGYVDHPTYKFGDNFGVEYTAHAGLYFDVMDELQFRIRMPFHLVANPEMDQAAGLDIAILFSSPQRNTKVRKLKY